MKPVEFKGFNVTYAKDQKEYLALPAFRDEKGVVVTCWRLSFVERLRMLFKGRTWVSIMTFNSPLQPMFVSVKREDVLVDKKNS